MSNLLNETSNIAPPHFIVIVPGYMGSKLRDKKTGEIIWIDFSSIPVNPFEWQGWIDGLFEKLAYPNEDIEPAGIVEDVLFLPPWIKQEQYSRMMAALQDMGYRADAQVYPEDQLDVYTFSYDWRQDNRISGRQLGQAIQHWREFHPGAEAWLIGHSNGGIVSRWYIEQEGGKDYVGKLFLMGSPWDGAPKSMRILFGGLDTLFRRRFNLFDIPRRTRDVLRTFPSSYQLIPVSNPFLRGEDNELINPFEDTEWLDDEKQAEYLQDALRFNQELGTTLSVESLCFFGRKLPTTSFGVVHKQAGEGWSEIEWFATEVGDGTVPERSAIHPQADQKLPFVVGHGDIYINPAVLEFLQWEMIDKYREIEYAVLITTDYSLLFEPDKDTYSPGETILITANAYGEADSQDQRPPMDDVSIVAALEWLQPLPGDSPAEQKVQPQSVNLTPGDEPGSYRAELLAPESEGYYSLTSVVRLPGEEPLTLMEVILVEAEPSVD
jgi:hypothetical protein